MMKQKQVDLKTRLLAWFLAVCLVVTLIPDTGYGTDDAGGAAASVDQYASEDASGAADEGSTADADLQQHDIVEKTERTTTYDIGGGEKTVVCHGSEVRFEDEEGHLVDYDPSLVGIGPKAMTEQKESLSGYAFTNSAGDMKHYIPEKMSPDVPVRMEYGDYSVEFSMTGKTIDDAGISEDPAVLEEDRVQTPYTDDAQLPVDAVYGGEQDPVEVRYTSMTDSVKETLVLNERPEENVFTFRLDLSGMRAKKNVTDEGITFYDSETGDIRGSVCAPWMNDAAESSYSEAVTQSIEEVEGAPGSYILTMTIDEGYLDDPERVYPVTVDPTVTWQGNDEIRDVYVIYSSTYKNTNFYESGTKRMPVGVNSTGTHRTYLHIFDLKSITKGYSVSSADLTVYETGTGASGVEVGIYRILEDWTSSTITWNNAPSCADLSQDTIITTGTAGKAHTFDVRDFARRVAKNEVSNYGLVMKVIQGGAPCASFHGSRASSYKPKLVVSYYDKPSVPATVYLSRNMGTEYIDTQFFRPGSYVYVSWNGISSYGLSEVQFRVDADDSETPRPTSLSADGTDLTPYKSIGTASSSYVHKYLPYSRFLPEGRYRAYIRGKDTAGNVGTGRYKVFVIDGTDPSLTNVSVTPSTSSSSYTGNRTPKVSWTATDKHFSKVTVSLNGTVLKTVTTSGAGSYTIPSGKITSSKEHVIKVTAYDKTGNTTTQARSYFVDVTAPAINSFKTTPETSAALPTKDCTPELSWDVSDSHLSAIEVYVGEKKVAEPAVTSKGIKLSEGDVPGTGTHNIKLVARDSVGNSNTKTIKYYADVDVPAGGIKITEQGTGEEVDVLKNTANIAVTASGTGSDLTEVELKLFKIADNGAETECHDFGKATVAENYDLNTQGFANGNYRLRLHLKDTVGYTNTVTKDVLIANPLEAPEITVAATNQAQTEVKWKVGDIGKISKFQYRIGNESGWTDITGNWNKNSGTFEVALPDEEGRYDIFVRAVDKYGIEGETAAETCILDKTAPGTELTAFENGYLIGDIADETSVTWELSVRAAADETGFEQLLSGETKVTDGKIAFIDLNEARYVAGSTYIFKLETTDCAGNVNSDIYEVTKSAAVIYPSKILSALEIKRPAMQDEGNHIIYPSDITAIQLSENADTSGEISWYVNNEKKAAGPTYECDFSIGNENSVYEKGKHYPILVINKKADGTRTYSSDIICNITERVSFNENGDEGQVDLAGKKVVSFSIADDGVEGSYYVKTGERQYVTVPDGETIYIAEIFDGIGYAEDITIKTDVPGDEVSLQLDVIDSDDIETFEISDIERYRPENLTVSDKINYKTYIKWKNEIDENTSENIYYEVYRGTEPDFAPGPENLAATGIRTGYFSEMNINFSGTFYYKVRAVEETETGKEVSSFSEEVYSRVVDADEYTKRMGVKDYWEFADIDTPNGTISVEKSMGNLVYQQTDVMLPNEGLEVELTRTYNSQSSAKSAFGIGWSHDYDIELLAICKDDEINDSNLIMKDGSGTIYHFIKGDDGTYTSSLGKYITLVKEEKSEELKIPARKKGTVTNTDEMVTVPVKSSYTIKTKDNVEYRFNNGGQLIYIGEANGNFLIIEYEPEKGVISKAITNRNLSMEFIYNDEQGTDKLTVKEVRLPNGTDLIYEYEGNISEGFSRLAKVTEKTASGETVSYEYGYDNADVPNVDVITDALGNEYKIEYTENDQVDHVEYPDGDMVKLEYDENVSDALEVTADQVPNLEKINIGLSTTTSKISEGVKVCSETDYFNEFGNCVLSRDPEGYETKYVYSDHLLEKTITETDSYSIDSEGYVFQNEKTVKEETTGYDKNTENETSETEADGTVTEYGYDEQANDLCDDLPVTEKEVTKNEKGETVEVFDLSYEYDESGNETKEYDAVSDITTVREYYSEDSASGLKGEIKREVEYLGTEEDGSLQSVTRYEYTYSEDGGKTEKVIQECGTGNDKVTITVTAVYDSMGNLIKKVDDRGKVEENTYDGFGRLISTKYTDGDIVTTVSKEYDKNGMVIKETAEDGTVTSYTYDEMGKVRSRNVTKGDFSKTWLITYGYKTIEVYNGSGAPIEVKNAFYTKETNPDNIETSVTYQDHLGRPVRQFKDGIFTDLTYDGQGNILTQYEYAAEQETGEGLLTMFIYDSSGNLTNTVLNPEYVHGKGYYTGGNAIVTSSEYDPSGNRIASIDGEGNRTEYSYDVEGHITSVKLPSGEITKYQYGVVNSDGTTSDFYIDAKGNKSEVVSDEGDLDILVQDLGDGTVDPIKTTFVYDEKENVIRETDAEGTFRTFDYDGRDRKVAAHYYDSAGNETQKTTYSYDISDNLTEMRDYTVAGETQTLIRITKYSYDELKRLVGSAELDGPDEPTFAEIEAATIHYEYDIDGKLIKVDYPENGSGIKGVEYKYDQYNWLTDIYADTGDLTNKKLREYIYYPNGKIAKVKNYTGVFTGDNNYIQINYSYDEFERVTSIEYTDSSTPDVVKESYKYQYDKNNNITYEEIKNDYPSSEEEKVHEIRTHEYNGNRQLISTKVEDKRTAKDNRITLYEYRYDAVGNRISESEESGISAVGADSDDSEEGSGGEDDDPDSETDTASLMLPFTAVAEADTTEDEESDVTDQTSEHSLKITSYTYNSLNQLVSSSEKTEDVVTSAVSYTYDKNGNQLTESDSVNEENRSMVYDAAGNMKRLVIRQGDTITLTQENVYNGEGQRIRKTEADDTVNYYYQGAKVLYTTDGTGALSAQNIIGNSDNTIATTRGIGENEAYYVYNKDIRDSTTNLVNESGESEVSYEYTDFGETEITGDTDFYNEICYTGGIYDASSGIYYLNARYYDPESANFLSQDSYRGEIGDPGSLNLYAYCNGNPTSYIDPSGHIPVLVVVAVKVGARIVLKQVAKKASKKIASKVVKKSLKKSIGKKYKVVKPKAKLKSAKLKVKPSKLVKKTNNKLNKPTRVKAGKKSSTKQKVSERRTNEQLVQEIATRAEKKVGGTGRVVGTKKHKYAKDLLDRYQKIYGDRGLKVEKSYKDGIPTNYGKKGSTRIDVLDVENKVAYDYKFTSKPGKGLSNKQIDKIKKHTKQLVQSVVEVNP